MTEKKQENPIWKYLFVGLIIGALFSFAFDQFPTLMILGIAAGLTYGVIEKSRNSSNKE
ncbi:hypothetical protein [Pseudidiomarina aestuarii]|uniref:hypothetical protein n=1 Tax=Pseudidiomarina aestuarii TaxID=624146 RepID=UPI0014730ED4|nr:hypothetical protein [Pseudidiomarina aestuarii]